LKQVLVFRHKVGLALFKLHPNQHMALVVCYVKLLHPPMLVRPQQPIWVEMLGTAVLLCLDPATSAIVDVWDASVEAVRHLDGKRAVA
jgi:hypothetical protein